MPVKENRIKVLRYLADNWPWETDEVEIRRFTDASGRRYIVTIEDVD